MCPRAADTKSATKRMRPISRMTPPSVLTGRGWTRTGASIRDPEQDATTPVTRFRGKVRLRGPVERKDLADLRSQVARRNELCQLLENGVGVRGASRATCGAGAR